MGGQCGDGYPPPDPVTTNQCNDYDNLYNMSDFCSLAGVGGKSYREEWCGRLGSGGEWGVEDTGGTNDCTYNDCHPYQVLPTGCCDGCCGIIGKSAQCKREQFNGTPIDCCLQDNICNDGGIGRNPQCNAQQAAENPNCNTPNNIYAPATCFSDSAKEFACAPCFRDITSSANSPLLDSLTTCSDHSNTNCQDLVYDYCTGADLEPGDISWMSRWYNTNTQEEGECVYALKRNLFKGQTYVDAQRPQSCNLSDTIRIINPNGTCTPYPNASIFNSNGVVYGRRLINGVYQRYADDGFVLGSLPGTLGYNPFQNVLYQTCCSLPIICQDGLNSTCSIYDAQRLSLNPEVANLCGCYLPESAYTTYVNSYQINKECTPMCNRPGTIPVVRGDNQPIRCNQDVCLIDDIAINLASTNVGGTIDISQVCSSCQATEGATASCSCIVANNSVDAAGADIGNINLNEQCGSVTCNVTNPDPSGNPPTLAIPCEELTDPDSDFARQLVLLREEEAKVARTNRTIRIVVVVVGLLIIFIALIVIRPNLDPKGAQTIAQKPKPEPTRLALPGEVGGQSLDSQATQGSNIIGSRSFR